MSNDSETPNVNVEGILSSSLQVFLSISMWHGYVRDQEVEHTVVENAEAENNAAIFYKKLSSCPLFKRYKEMSLTNTQRFTLASFIRNRTSQRHPIWSVHLEPV